MYNLTIDATERISPSEEVDNQAPIESKENEHENSSTEKPEESKGDNTAADNINFSEDEEDLLFDLDDPLPEKLDVLAPTQKVDVDINEVLKNETNGESVEESAGANQDVNLKPTENSEVLVPTQKIEVDINEVQKRIKNRVSEIKTALNQSSELSKSMSEITDMVVDKDVDNEDNENLATLAPTQKIEDNITEVLKHETRVEPVEENSDQEESSKSSPTSSSPTETPNRRKRKLYTLVPKADVSTAIFFKLYILKSKSMTIFTT